MILKEVLARAINPALAYMPLAMGSDSAKVLMLAIGMQESGFETRTQRNGGPARGFWQFERSGGVLGVIDHPASRRWADTMCAVRDVECEATAVWRALAVDDVLAAAFARLLLWTDRQPLPAIGDAPGAWAYYLRNWRPGKPHPDAWPDNYAAARLALLPASRGPAEDEV